jgi:hypothetical protein
MRSNNNNREAAENRGECEDRRKGKKYEEKLSISSILKLCFCSASPNTSSTSNSFFLMLTSVLLFIRLYAFT